MNRSDFRSQGLQGRRSTTAKGKFTGRFGRTPILVSNAPGWSDRKIARVLGETKTGRVARTLARMRAAGEMDKEVSFDSQV